MSDTTLSQQSWIERLLSTDLPAHIKRIASIPSPTLEGLRTDLHATVLSLIGDIGAYAHDINTHFQRLTDELGEALDDHEDRLAAAEAFIEALGQETQLLAPDAEDVAKLAAGAKWLAGEVLAKGEQTEEGKARLGELIVLAERVGKLAADARLDVEPDEEDELEETAPAPN